MLVLQNSKYNGLKVNIKQNVIDNPSKVRRVMLNSGETSIK